MSEDPAGDVVLPAPPRLAPLYARALLTHRRPRPAAVDPRSVTVAPVVLDAAHAARYAAVCGAPPTGAVPLTYPHLLAFSAQVHLMAAHPFPLALLGLVHVRQHVTSHRPVAAGEALAVRVWAEHLAPHPRGRTVDLRAVVHVGEEVVWQGRSTYLSREPTESTDPPPGRGPSHPPAPLPPAPAPEGPASALWPVAAGTGRRYAAVSGDVNPIHLSAPTARALGFPRAIAHGMWTLARTLSALSGQMPPAVTVDVAFASPVLLPSTVALLVHPVPGTTGGAGTGWDVAVRSPSGERLHLSGAVRELPGAVCERGGAVRDGAGPG